MVIDFARPSKSNTILVAENDANSRNCLFTLLSDKKPFDMTDVVSATVKAVKPSGSIVYGDATIIEDDEGNKLNELEYLLPLDMTEDAGTVTITITLANQLGDRITSFEYYVKVRNALYNEDDYIDDDDLDGFRELLTRTKAALDKMEQMTKQDALPNPYPLRISLDNVDYEYSGNNLVEILMDAVAYFGDYSGTVEITEDDSAAAIAVQAAQDAEDAQEAAEAAQAATLLMKTDVDQSRTTILNIVQDFTSKIPTAEVDKPDGSTTATITIRDQNGTTTADISDGSRWIPGTALVGQGTGKTGAAGSRGDFYFNTTSQDMYVCTATGDDTTATWDFLVTLGQSVASVAWGAINGTLTDQSDLATALNNLTTALNGKANISHTHATSDVTGLATVATTNSYVDLSNKPTVDQTFSGVSTNAQSGVAIKGALDDKADKTELDGWTAAQTTLDGTTVSFPGLNDSYGYLLCCTDKLVSITNISKTGSGTNVTYTYTVDGAAVGDTFRLRIFK